MKRFIFILSEGIKVEIEAKTFNEAHLEYEKVKEEVSGENVKIIQRPAVKKVKQNLKNHLLDLKEKGFFKEAKSLRDITEKLRELAIHYPMTTIPAYLNPLIREGILKRTSGKREDKEVWLYENN